jgi:4-hydroxy-tetrahydrodipicolinate reductase
MPDLVAGGCGPDNATTLQGGPVTADSNNIALAIAGASGRMGRRVLELAVRSGDISLVGAWVGAGSPRRGQHAGAGGLLDFATIGEVAAAPDVVVDFSRADAFDDVLSWCVSERVALVSGTTGLTPGQQAAIDDAARTIAVVWSANFSPGVAVLMHAAEQAARVLADWDVEIAESHHAGKRDAPSGTALSLGRAIAQARGDSLEDRAEFDRRATDRVRPPGAIGFAVTRAGDIVGEHTVLLATAGERLEFSHRATDRGIFARGALHAARWLVGRPPGRYRFDDSLA